MPGGVSAPISVKPVGVTSIACMIRSAMGVSAWPNSPKVETVEVTAQHGPVELHRLAGVVLEAEVGVES